MTHTNCYVIVNITLSKMWRNDWLIRNQVNINYFLQNFGYGRDYIYSSSESALNQFANLSQRKELADYDDLWNGYKIFFWKFFQDWNFCRKFWLRIKFCFLKKKRNFYIRSSLYLLLPRSELLKSLFAIYDRNQTYCFTFRDFLYIRATRAAPALENLNISNIFKVKIL